MDRRAWLALSASALLAACERGRRAPAAGAMRDATDAAVSVGDRARIVTVGGVVTEIVAALGALDRVVAVDASSTFPAAVSRLPQVGYLRQLAAEGVLSLRPSLVITTTEVGPPTTLAQLRGAGVAVFVVEGSPGMDAARQRIRRIAAVLDKTPQGDALVRALDADLARVPAATGARPKVLFLYARGPGAPQVAGRDTAADAMISLAGAENPMRGRWSGYRPLTTEGLVAAAPDVLLVTEHGLGAMGGPAAIAALPGVAQTPCGRPGRTVVMEDLLLLGFGPRAGAAVATLSERLRAAVAG
ncbi:MAG: ABC transporter substrate-binding protein [Deltaproteobacteria bacterium]|nr:ABC transporter substrate-binding protein [Myxococcales bacterium]MDP3217543.1 ABC transporter substrate-binding protein [Deltaproteobacteria bacterium]